MSPNINTWCTVNIYPFQTNIFSDTQMQEIENSQQQNRKGGHSWLAKWDGKKNPLTFHNWVVFHPLRKPEKTTSGYFETIIQSIIFAHLRCGQQSKPMPRSLANISAIWHVSHCRWWVGTSPAPLLSWAASGELKLSGFAETRPFWTKQFFCQLFSVGFGWSLLGKLRFLTEFIQSC